MIPFHHVSAGVCTVSCGMGVWDLSTCMMMAGNEHFFYAGFPTQARREKIPAFLHVLIDGKYAAGIIRRLLFGS